MWLAFGRHPDVGAAFFSVCVFFKGYHDMLLLFSQILCNFFLMGTRVTYGHGRFPICINRQTMLLTSIKRNCLPLLVLLNYCKCRFCSPYVTVATTQLQSVSNISSKNRSLRSFSVISGDIPVSITSGNVHLDMRRYQVVVAATRDMGIGKDGKLPWRLPSDLNFFKELTMTTSDPRQKNAIVMGRKTWESIPLKYRPLLGRLNVVLSRSGCSDMTTTENVVRCQSIPSALEFLAKAPYCFSIEKVFVIGGGQILRETINAPGCDAIHITEIETSTECDTFIPNIDS